MFDLSSWKIIMFIIDKIHCYSIMYTVIIDYFVLADSKFFVDLIMFIFSVNHYKKLLKNVFNFFNIYKKNRNCKIINAVLFAAHKFKVIISSYNNDTLQSNAKFLKLSGLPSNKSPTRKLQAIKERRRLIRTYSRQL